MKKRNLQNLTAQELVAILRQAMALQQNEPSRITYCKDCDCQISSTRRWQNECQRCSRCHARFMRKQAKKGKPK